MKRKRLREGFLFALFVLPAVALVLFVSDLPFLMNLYYSVFDWNGISRTMEFVKLDNFVKIFTNDIAFWKSALFTLRFAVFYTLIVNAIAIVVALVLAKEKKISGVGRAFYYIPYIIGLTAISLIWKFIFGSGFEALYKITGWEFLNWSWIGTPNLAFYVIVIITVWQSVGFYMVNYIAGIITVPKELNEAAKIDGANSLQVFRRITLPMIMPSVSICMLTSLTSAFKLFDIIMVFTKGGPFNTTATVAYHIYKEAFVSHHYGMATAKSLVFVVFVLCVTAIQLKITKSREVEA